MTINSPRFRRATFLLLLIGLLLHGLDYYWYKVFPLNQSFSLEELEAINASWQQADSAKLHQYNRKMPDQLNLNSANYDDLQQSGLNESLAKRLIAYRASLSGFDSLGQLQNIYGIDTNWLKAGKGHFNLGATFKNNSKESQQVLRLDSFNPNEVGEDELKRMGLKAKQIRGIMAFREHFRPFQKAKDLYEVYNLDSGLVKRLLPYAKVSNSDTLRFNKVIDINSADSASLRSLPGIGPLTVNYFLDYRKALGGFHSLYQLEDLFFIDSLWIATNQSRIRVDSISPSLNINKASLADLKEHPYISYGLARNIVEFRERIGLFKSLDELVNIELVDDVLLRKLAPYLSISN